MRQNDGPWSDGDRGRAGARLGEPPVVRGLTTLLGVAAAGFLVWLATQFDLGSTGEYWAAMGILAGAGACLGLSQLLGGWTKWGAPTISPGVFLLAFLPTLRRGRGHPRRHAADRHGGGRAGRRLDPRHRPRRARRGPDRLPGRPRVRLGIVFAFTFDTRGPRSAPVERDTVVARRGGARLPRPRSRSRSEGDGRRERSDPSGVTREALPSRQG